MWNKLGKYENFGDGINSDNLISVLPMIKMLTRFWLSLYYYRYISFKNVKIFEDNRKGDVVVRSQGPIKKTSKNVKNFQNIEGERVFKPPHIIRVYRKKNWKLSQKCLKDCDGS